MNKKLLHEKLRGNSRLKGDDNLMAGMPGKILDIFVKPGDKLKEGDSLLIMEAMKMENEMFSNRDCVVKKVHVLKNQNVDKGTCLISFQ